MAPESGRDSAWQIARTHLEEREALLEGELVGIVRAVAAHVAVAAPHGVVDDRVGSNVDAGTALRMSTRRTTQRDVA